SRLEEQTKEKGAYNRDQAIRDYEKCILGQGTDNMKDLTYADRKAVHNLKYYTWVEQQAKDSADLQQLWYDREIWNKLFTQAEKWDEMIKEFNEATGVLKSL
nr:pyridoxal-5-phosphate-dependent protein subunit beta [Spirochaetota bacterium]